MALSLNSDAPVSKLDRYLLWKIFSVNAEADPYDNPNSFHIGLFPLTNTVCCSQVCSFWRSIILDSPSIWGNCLDLELLWQDHDDWRREVLRRTGNALLAVRDHHPIMQYPSIDVLKFTIDIISDHWERIKVLNISVGEEIVKDMGVRNAFCRPARDLRVFAIRDERLNTRDPAFIFPPNDQLFSNDAPLLYHFSVAQSIFPPSSLIPIPSILRTGQLRHLTLKQPLVVPVLDLLSAIAQMPLLEVLAIEVVNLILEGLQEHYHSTSSLQTISLPRLKSIWITSNCLEIYPKFVGRLVAHPSKMDIHTTLDSMPSYPSETLGQYANELRDILLRDVSDFFQQNHSIGSSSIKYLVLGLSGDHVSLAAYQQMNRKYPYINTVFEAQTIPLIIRESFVNMLLHLNLPTTLLRFRFIYSNSEYRQWNIPLSPFFKALESITELYVSLEGLAYITEQSNSEGITFFESLRIVFLHDSIETQNTRGAGLKHFLTARQHSAPIEILDLTESIKSFGDLRYLDEIAGLTVRWNGKGPNWQTGRMEYKCGSGDPECLLHT